MSGIWDAFEAIRKEREASGEPPTEREVEVREGRAWGQQPSQPSQPATGQDIAALYDRLSGVPGWTARIDSGEVFLTPPPGYVEVHGEDGSRCLVKISSIRPMGISIRETAE